MGYTISYKTTLGQPATVVESANPSDVNVGDKVRVLILGSGGDLRGSIDKTGIVTKINIDGDMITFSIDDNFHPVFYTTPSPDGYEDRAIQII